MRKITNRLQIIVLSVVLPLLITSIVILLASSNHLAFAQIPGVINAPPSSGSDQQQQQPQPQSTSSVESTKNYVNYKDPQGRFSIDYPSGWDVNSATNRFETMLVQFQSGKGLNLTAVNIGIVRNVPGIISLGLEQVFNRIMNTGDKQIVEPVECSKYTMDGNQACSVIYIRRSAFSTQLETPALQIISVIGDHIYVFTYGASKDNFDKSLPIAEHMINSFKFGPQATS